jgi:CyaY protein
MLSESEFNTLIDELLLKLEEAIDDCGVDIDYETAGGVMTIIFENGTQVIINRQTPVRQLWLATKTGGFHFDLSSDDGRWYGDVNGREFMEMLNEACSLQSGEKVELTL